MNECETQPSAGQYNADFEQSVDHIAALIAEKAPPEVIQVALLREILSELRALRTEVKALDSPSARTAQLLAALNTQCGLLA